MTTLQSAKIYFHKKVKSLLRHDTKSEWLTRPAIDWTFGEGNVLPPPTVGQPTPAQLEGRDLPKWPGYIALEVTNVCNIECTHCNYRHGVPHYTRDRGFMNMETADRVLTEAKANGASVLMNYDGEPLMNKKFMDYLKLCQSKGVLGYFNTNGTLFDKKFADEVVTFFKGAIFFSVDGDREWFNKIRVGADYDKVVANLEYFLKVNEEAGWPISVGIGFCNLGQSAEHRREFVDRWVDKVNFVSLGEVNDKMGSMISTPMTEMEIQKRPVCVVPWQTVGITHNGDVVPCSIYITRANTANAVLGNIWENSIEEIWNGENMRNFRKMLVDREIENTYCQSCERWRCQFSWPDIFKGDRKIERNGYWTSVYNLKRGLPKTRGG